MLIDASSNNNLINLIKLIPLYEQISGTNESLVIPGWVFVSKDKNYSYNI